MNSEEVEHLLDECRTIDENCLYTGQTHFIMADSSQKKARLMILIPSLIAVASGAIAAVFSLGWAGGMASGAAGFASLASVLGVDRNAISHRSAGNLLTSLRHEVRALHESFWKEMSREQLYFEVKRLNDKYNCVCLALDSTDNKAFEKARERIKKGRFEPDFRMGSTTNRNNGKED